MVDSKSFKLDIIKRGEFTLERYSKLVNALHYLSHNNSTNFTFKMIDTPDKEYMFELHLVNIDEQRFH
jgi:hypothetical protein